MSEEKEKKEKNEEIESETNLNIDLGLGGLFKGLGKFVEMIGDMTEKGEEIREKVQEFKGKGPLKDIKGVYGFSVKTGLGGKMKVEPFGNIKSTPKGPVVEETREPIMDVFEEQSTIQVVAEIPGVEAETVNVNIKGDVLNLSAENGDRKYAKEVLLPSEVKAEPISRSYKNGIFEVRFEKK